MIAHRHRLEGTIFRQGRAVCRAIARATTIVRRLRRYVSLDGIEVQYRVHHPLCWSAGDCSLAPMRASPLLSSWRAMRLVCSQRHSQPRKRGDNDGQRRATNVTLLVKSQICRKRLGHAMLETQKDRDHVPMKCTLVPVEITRR